MKKLGLEIEIKKIQYEGGLTTHLITVLNASDGLTTRIFLPTKRGSIIRIAEGNTYSLTKGVSLEKGYPEIVYSEDWEGELPRPCSQGEFPVNVDIEDILIIIIRERLKVRNSLALGERMKIYI